MTNNYQLYRTNILLGGQIKMDLKLESVSSDVYVTEYGMSPVDEGIPYNRCMNNTLLNNSHLNNIKNMYEQLGNNFYRNFPNPIVSSQEPLIINENERPEIHDSSTQMGLKRTIYQLYGKQFEFFCPVWLEDIKDKTLCFKFNINTKRKSGGYNLLCSKILKLKVDKKLLNGSYIHNRFVNYFNDYLNSIKPDDKIMSINLKDGEANIRGIDVSKGLLISDTSINHLAKDLLNNEKLLMDADNLIINNFKNNKLIAKQLFNFNFIFDIDEFVDRNTLNQMYGSQIFIDVQAGYISKNSFSFIEFDIKDFYSNYDYIERKVVSDVMKNDGKNNNIFNYLKDPQAIVLQNKNKTRQNIIHWSLSENNDYIFNTYTGFGGYINEDTITDGTYQDSPDIWSTKYSDAPSGINWCKVVKIENGDMIYDMSINSPKPGQYSIIGDEWSYYLHYGTSAPQKMVCMFVAPDGKTFNNIKSYLLKKKILTKDTTKNGVIFSRIGNLYYILTYNGSISVSNNNSQNALDNLMFANIRKNTGGFDSECWLIKDYMDWFNSIIEPNKYLIKGLGYTYADSPEPRLTTELDYYNIGGFFKDIIRYDGNIKPTFVSIDKNNTFIKKEILRDNLENTSYYKYVKGGYEKLFPSIDYYPWKLVNIELVDEKFVKPLDELLSQEEKLPFEYKWYNTSSYKLLYPTISFNIGTVDNPSDPLTDDDQKNETINYLKSLYNIDEEWAVYIYNLYNMSIYWEYAGVYIMKEEKNTKVMDSNKYIYTIKLNLK